MRSFKKALVSFLAFLLCVVLFSGVMLVTFERYTNDKPHRDAMAGTIDTIYCGASMTERAIIPSSVDEILGTASYNLSSVWQSNVGALALLKEELARNPVKTVVLGASYDTMRELEDDNYCLGNMYVLSRLGNNGARLEFLTKNVPVSVWFDMYISGLNYGSRRLAYFFAERPSYQGYFPANTVNVAVSEEKLEAGRNTQKLDTYYPQEKIDSFRELITVCQEAGATVVVAVMPVSKTALSVYSGWDVMYETFASICEETGCAFVDFNLLTARDEILSDENCFSDVVHLSKTGAKRFTPVFATVLQTILDGGEYQGYFTEPVYD